MAVAGSRVSACDPLPFLLPFWLWTLHNTLYLSSTASPSSLLSSRPPRQHRRRWSPSCCAGRVARAIREVKPRPASGPPAQRASGPDEESMAVLAAVAWKAKKVWQAPQIPVET